MAPAAVQARPAARPPQQMQQRPTHGQDQAHHQPAQQQRMGDGGKKGNAARGQAPARSDAVSPAPEVALANELVAVLEPHGYTKDDIMGLVKSCGCDAHQVQAKVLSILEEASTEADDHWTNQATIAERKEQAAQAKERRLQREKEMAEEKEREKERRNKAFANAQLQARKRAQAEEANRLKDRLKVVESQGVTPEVAKPSSTVARPGWRASSPEEEAEEVDAIAEDSPEVAEQEATPVAEEVTPTQQHENEHLWSQRVDAEEEASAQEASSLSTPAVWQAAIPPETVEEEPWEEAVVPQVGQQWTASAPQWTPEVQTAPHWPPQQPQQRTSAPCAWEEEHGDSGPSVEMPPSYAALFGSGPEPEVMFGSLASDDIPASSSANPASWSAPQQPAAAAVDAETSQPEARAPRSHARGKGGGDGGKNSWESEGGEGRKAWAGEGGKGRKGKGKSDGEDGGHGGKWKSEKGKSRKGKDSRKGDGRSWQYRDHGDGGGK